MPQALVITLADTDPPPIGSIIATDQDRDIPVVIAHTERPSFEGATVVALSDPAPPVIPDPGDGSGPRAYRHNQISAAVTWTIPHNLGFRPCGIVAKENGTIIEPSDVQYPDLNTCVLYWSNIPVSGTVDLS